jgi:soluble lytic murein transglycosylase-like protein
MRLPRYDGPQVESTNLRGNFSDGNISPETFGAGIGRGLADVGQVVQKIGLEQQAKANDAALMAFKNEMSSLESELLFDPENGAYARQGAESFNLEGEVLPVWDQRQQAAIERLPPHLRERASLIGGEMRIGARQGIMRHVLQQTDAYRDQQADAMVAGATNAAILNYKDPARLGEELANVETAIDMKLRGAAPEMVAGAKRAARSKALSGVILREVQDDPWSGDALLQQYREQLDAGDLVGIEAELRPLKEADEVDNVARAIVSGQPTSLVVPPQRGKPSPAIRTAIEAAAGKYGVPPEYLYALAEQESSFRPRAVGAVTSGGEQAVGVMQYLPSTAREQGIDPLNPTQAIDAAARQFAARMKANGPEYAIAAHFAGDGGAAAVVKRGRTAENPKTARYVVEVTGRAMRWRGDGPAAAQVAPQGAGSPGVPSTLGDRLAAVGADPRATDPRWRRKVEERVRSLHAIEEADRADAERTSLERMRSVVAAADGSRPLAKLLEPADYALAQQQGWDDLLQNSLDRKRLGVLTRTDPVINDAFMRLATRDPAQFAKPETITEIWKAEGSLATPDLKRLQDLWVAANTPDKAGKAQTERKVESALVRRGLMRLGDDFQGSTPQAKKRAAAFGLAIAQARDAWRASNPGREPTPDQDEAMVGAVVQQFLADPEGRAERASALSGFGLTMSPADRKRVRDTLRAKGVENPSEAQVTALWAQFKAAQEQ